MKISGSFTVSFEVNNLGDLREAMRMIDKAGLSDDYEVDLEWSTADGSSLLHVYPYHATDGELVHCGDCAPDEWRSDIVLFTHKHEVAKPETEEVKPGWDWIRRLVLPEEDRFADEARPE